MLVDFCHGLWDTRVDSDVVSSDGYEVSNLISRENSKKRKGFLAAGFVKPIVTVLLSFPFPIDLYALNINPQVGAQNTCGLEILAASLKPRNQQDIRSTSDEITFSTSRRRISRTSDLEFTGLHNYQYELNINNIKQEFNNLFQQVLRVRIPEGKIGHFVNPCSQQIPQGDSKIVENGGMNAHKCRLQHGQLLRRASHLVVRITQCHKGSVPCLGAVEVFGQPAQNCGTFVVNYARLISSRLKETKQEIARGLYTQDETKRPSIGPSNEGSPLATPVSTDSTNRTRSPSDHVPDEFIDPITLSIMTLPVLLPSGTTIDQTTLEKHINSEKNWGRPPSDPFTGLALGSKVVPNAALKCRIDNFLLSSDVSVGDVGRTVGSALLDCRSRAKVNVDVIKVRSKFKDNDQIRQKVSGKRTAIVNESNDNIQPPSKRQKSGVKQTCNSPNPDDLDLALEDALCARKKPATLNQSVSISSLVKTSGSTLNGKQRDTESRSSTESAFHACPHQGQDSVLFQLPCQHIVCRRCLTCAVENTQCPNCRRNFDKKNVIRVHSISTNTL